MERNVVEYREASYECCATRHRGQEQAQGWRGHSVIAGLVEFVRSELKRVLQMHKRRRHDKKVGRNVSWEIRCGAY